MDIKEIIGRITSSSRLEYCAICGKCLAVCPTYRELSQELHSPRGRLNLVKAYLCGELPEVGGKFFESLDWCLLCGACDTVCPAQIRPAEAVMYARALPEFRRRQSRLEKVILEKVVTKQARLTPVSVPLRLGRQTGFLEVLRESKVQQLLPRSLRTMQDLLPLQQGPAFSGRSQQPGQVFISGDSTGTRRVKFFLGCAMNIILPDVVSDSMRLLNSAGCTVSTQQEFYCCGAPHLHEGDLESARELAEINVKLLAADENAVITADCDSCVAMIKKYAEILRETELAEQAENVSRRALAMTELLTQLEIHKLARKNLGGMRVTWDDPCELIHAQGISRQPREILRNLPGVEFVELPESDWCCGCGGAYVLKHPDLSDRILQRKLDAIRSIGVDMVLTSNPGCLMQLDRGLRRLGIKTQVQHLTTFLARNLLQN